MTEGKEQTRVNNLPLYKPVGFYMVRTPALSTDIFMHITAESSVSEHENQKLERRLMEARQRGYDVLKTLSADSLVQHALLVASTDLFNGLERLEHRDTHQRRREHVYSGLLRYLVRMSTRPTPFGLFSGVAIGTLSEQTTLRMGSPAIQHTRTRPDMEWLLSLIQQIEADETLLPQLTLEANHTVYLAGARAIIPYADIYGKGDTRSIALRATDVVQHVLRRARQPLPYHALRQDMLITFPFATEQQVDGLLRQLWEHRFLISDLRPPLTSAEPEKYVLERLSQIPWAAELAKSLEEVVKQAADIDRVGPGTATAHLRQLIRHQRLLVPDQKRQPFQVDSALHLEETLLNQKIGEAVADATETLLRMTPFPKGPRHIREYYLAFCERYGMDAEVPLLDLLSPEIGLGAPSPYTEPPRDYQLPPLHTPSGMQARDSVLCSLLSEALYQQKQEVELTDAYLQQLQRWEPKPENAPPATLEMCLQLHAASREAIDRGEWRGVIAPMSIACGGRTFCRFFDVLGADGVKWLREYARQEEATSSDAIFAELSYLPPFGYGANVAIRPALRSYEIVLNATPSVPDEQVIPLHDLMVGVKGGLFYLRSHSRNKAVVVTQSHMLNITRAPNLCRFLMEVSQDGKPLPAPFDWGAARYAPFLPRVVRKNMVLSPAQWQLRRSMIELVGNGSEETRFFAGVQQWREQWRVPRYVYMTQADNRLLLDLEHPLLVAELHDELKKLTENSAVSLQEMLPDFEHLWLRDRQNAPYMAELVVPLIVNEHGKAQQTLVDLESAQQWLQGHPRHQIASHERCFLPGGAWTFLKLYVTPKQQDEVIAGPLREIVYALQEQQLIDRWFFIRYADPEPHLRVRFHAHNEQAKNAVLINALTWGRQLVSSGLIRNVVVDTYAREIERYGGPKAIDALEQVFTVNSESISKIVEATYTGKIILDPLAIAVFTLDQFFDLWGMDLPNRLGYIQGQTSKYDRIQAFRAQRQLYCELLMPWDPDYDLAIKGQREQLHQLCVMQQPVLQQVSAHVKALAEQDELWVSEQQLLGSLAHMHINRLLGTSREEEQQGYAFWRHTLESILRRPAQKGTKANVLTKNPSLMAQS